MLRSPLNNLKRTSNEFVQFINRSYKFREVLGNAIWTWNLEAESEFKVKSIIENILIETSFGFLMSRLDEIDLFPRGGEEGDVPGPVFQGAWIFFFVYIF